jgi:hypothetical protein
VTLPSLPSAGSNWSSWGSAVHNIVSGLASTYLAKTGGAVNGNLTFATNTGASFRGDTPSGNVSPLVDFFAVTEFSRSGIRWFDEAGRLRATTHYHTTNFSDGAHHEAYEIKTSDDPTGPTPNGLLTRVSVRTDKTQANGSIWMSGDLFLDGARPTQQVTVERQAASPVTGGSPLTIQAGGASPGGTNTTGGDLILSPGTSTGSARSGIQFRTAISGASGTADNAPTLAAYLANSGTTANNAIFALNNSTSFGTAPFGNAFAVSGENAGGFSAFRRTTADSPGQNLTVQAGGATVGATDKAGGNLILRAGTSTGTGEGQVRIATSAPGATGTADNGTTTRATFDSTGAVFTGNRVNVATSKTPATATAAGTAGDICWDSGFVYVCVATNTWKRSALATW